MSPLRYINLFYFQPCGFGVLEDSEPDFSFRSECRVLIVDPDDQPQRWIRAHGRLQHLDIIHFECNALLAPIEAVSVPLGHIHAESDSLLANDAPHEPARRLAREGERQPRRHQQRMEPRRTERLRQKSICRNRRGKVILPQITKRQITLLRRAEEPGSIRQRRQTERISSKPKRQPKWIVPQPKSPRPGDGRTRGPRGQAETGGGAPGESPSSTLRIVIKLRKSIFVRWTSGN